MMSNISPKFAVVRGSLQATPLQSNVWCMIWHRSCEPCHWLGKLCCDHRLATQSSETFPKARSWHFLLDYLYYIMFSIAILDLSEFCLRCASDTSPSDLKLRIHYAVKHLFLQNFGKTKVSPCILGQGRPWGSIHERFHCENMKPYCDSWPVSRT